MAEYGIFIALAYGVSLLGLVLFALSAWRRRRLARRLAQELG